MSGRDLNPLENLCGFFSFFRDIMNCNSPAALYHQTGMGVPYETRIDVVAILTSTLYLLEHSFYPAKDSVTIADLAAHIRRAIADLEAAKIPAQSETLPTPRVASARTLPE